MIDRLLSVLAPHRCSSCGAEGTILCESCKYDIVSERFSFCVFCNKPCGERGVCADCGKKGVEQAWCVGERDGALKKLLDDYKFSSSRAASETCASLFDLVLPKLPDDTVVVGIPSSPHTVRTRGFAHIERIVERLARLRHLSHGQPLRRQTNATLHFLPRKARIKLGPTLFSLSEAGVPPTVLLIDDIVTTGTTLSAAIKLLKKAGVKRVYVAVIARQPER